MNVWVGGYYWQTSTSSLLKRVEAGSDTLTLQGIPAGDLSFSWTGTGSDNLQINVAGGPAGDSILLVQQRLAGHIEKLTLDGLGSNELWFAQQGNNLVVSVLGTTDKVTVSNWFAGSGNVVETIKSGDGKVLHSSDIATLVAAMAGFAEDAYPTCSAGPFGRQAAADKDGIEAERIAAAEVLGAAEFVAFLSGRGCRYPCMITSASGTELTSDAILAWLEDRHAKPHHIAPGKPMQNGFAESFSGLLHDERLNGLFNSYACPDGIDRRGQNGACRLGHDDSILKVGAYRRCSPYCGRLIELLIERPPELSLLQVGASRPALGEILRVLCDRRIKHPMQRRQ